MPDTRKERRAKWIAENGPCKHCGSSENLEVDHIDPETKSPKLRSRHTGGCGLIWDWSKEHREAELAKCQVLCNKCHVKKSKEESLAKKQGILLYTEFSTQKDHPHAEQLTFF